MEGKKIILYVEFILLVLSVCLAPITNIVMVQYVINTVIIILLLKNSYYCGWYVFSFAIVLYSFPHFVSVFFFEANPLFEVLKEYGKVGNNKRLNVVGYNYINILISSLILFSTFFNYKRDVKINLDVGLKKTTILIVVVVILFFFVIGATSIDYAALSNEYALSDGFSLVFGSYYWLSFLLLYYFAYILYYKKSFAIFITILIITQSFLFFLGVRQMIFWFLLSLVFMFFIVRDIKKEKIRMSKIIKIMGIGFSVIYVIGVVTKYRVTKVIDSDTLNLYNSLNMFYLGYNAETSLTIYNLMSSVEQSLKGNDFFFFPEVRDFVIMMIPSFWLDGKANYLSFVSFDNEFNVAPFGTYFVVGELILSLRYKFLFVVFAFFVNLFSHYFYLKFLVKTNFVKIVVYTFGLSILFFSPVRGLIAPAVKIFITFVASIYFLNKLTFRQSKYIGNYEENKN